MSFVASPTEAGVQGYEGMSPVQSEDAIRGKSLFSRPLRAPGSLTGLRPAGTLARFVLMATLSQMPSNNIGSCTFEKAVRLRAFSPKYV